MEVETGSNRRTLLQSLTGFVQAGSLNRCRLTVLTIAGHFVFTQMTRGTDSQQRTFLKISGYYPHKQVLNVLSISRIASNPTVAMTNDSEFVLLWNKSGNAFDEVEIVPEPVKDGTDLEAFTVASMMLYLLECQCDYRTEEKDAPLEACICEPCDTMWVATNCTASLQWRYA